MGIQKQEFYEGAALYRLIRGSDEAKRIAYVPPFFIVDGCLQIYLKYSTAKRSPWSYTFMPEEQELLCQHARSMPVVIGLICGADGVAAVPYEDYLKVAPIKSAALRVSCKRNHREHFEVGGPNGTLPEKIAPASWNTFLNRRKI